MLAALQVLFMIVGIGASIMVALAVTLLLKRKGDDGLADVQDIED